MPEDQKKDERKEEAQLQLPKELTDTLSGINKSLGMMGEAVSNLNARVDKMSTDKDKKAEKKEVSDFRSDLETISRKDFFGEIVKMLGDKFATKSDVEDISKRLTKKLETDEGNEIHGLIKKAERDHKDFWDWKTEMKELIKRNPSLTPEDAYVLARASDKEKATELDEKYNPSDEKGDEEKGSKGSEDDELGNLRFGGIMPTSGKTEDAKNLSADEAAETAWRRVFSGSKE